MNDLNVTNLFNLKLEELMKEDLATRQLIVDTLSSEFYKYSNINSGKLNNIEVRDFVLTKLRANMVPLHNEDYFIKFLSGVSTQLDLVLARMYLEEEFVKKIYSIYSEFVKSYEEDNK